MYPHGTQVRSGLDKRLRLSVRPEAAGNQETQRRKKCHLGLVLLSLSLPSMFKNSKQQFLHSIPLKIKGFMTLYMTLRTLSAVSTVMSCDQHISVTLLTHVQTTRLRKLKLDVSIRSKVRRKGCLWGKPC